MLRVFRVTGHSMRPTLSEGDFVIALARQRLPRPGELVVINHPGYGILVKRVLETDPASGRTRCRGDNPASVDADSLGWIGAAERLGIVFLPVRAPRRKPATLTR